MVENTNHNSFASMNKIDHVELDNTDDEEIVLLDSTAQSAVCQVPEETCNVNKSVDRFGPHPRYELFGCVEGLPKPIEQQQEKKEEIGITFTSDEFAQIAEKYNNLGVNITSTKDLLPYIKNIYLKALNIKNG